MKYISNINYCVCRIDVNGVIKIADFGLTEDMYITNYFRKEICESENEEKVPIRWMAPESINGQIYNEKTDVVSLYFSCICIIYYYVH